LEFFLILGVQTQQLIIMSTELAPRRFQHKWLYILNQDFLFFLAGTVQLAMGFIDVVLHNREFLQSPLFDVD
jgi:hypothetical protein